MLEQFPQLEFEEFILREIMPEDAAEFLSYLQNPNVNKYVPESEVPKDEASAKSEIMYWRSLYYRGSSIYWAVADKGTNKLIGSCGFNYWNKQYRRIEISYDLSENYWHRGIATRMVAAITDFSFNKLSAQRVQATVVTDNERSIGVLERCSYEREGLLRKYAILNSKSVDSYMYAKIAP